MNVDTHEMKKMEDVTEQEMKSGKWINIPEVLGKRLQAVKEGTNFAKSTVIKQYYAEEKNRILKQFNLIGRL